MKTLNLYTLDISYYQYLAEFDKKIPFLKDGKENRPFIGIVLIINGVNYFSPLSSPKPKYQKLKNDQDFEKISGGKYGAINFNNMIPVPLSCIYAVDMHITKEDTKEELAYKNLLNNQLTWCNVNQPKLMNKAANLRKIITTTNREALKQRCCDFVLLEEKCRIYQEKLPIEL